MSTIRPPDSSIPTPPPFSEPDLLQMATVFKKNLEAFHTTLQQVLEISDFVDNTNILKSLAEVIINLQGIAQETKKLKG